MSKSKPPPTEELIASAQALRKTKSSSSDHTSDRLVKEAEASLKDSRPPDTRQLIVESEKLIGRDSAHDGQGSSMAPVVVILLIVVALGAGAFFLLQ